MKKKLLSIFLLLIGILFLNPTTVDARSSYGYSTVIYPGEGEVGSFTVYDDYVVRVSFKYKAENVKLTLCPKNSCGIVEPTIKEFNEQYTSGGYVDFYLTEYFEMSNGVTYTLKVTAEFKQYPAAIDSESPGELDVEFEYIKENASFNEERSEDKYAEEALTWIEKIVVFCKTYIIYIIYAILGIVLVIKGILLGIDIARYADQPEVRKEKLKAFAFFGVAIFLLAILNTIAGIVGDLF